MTGKTLFGKLVWIFVGLVSPLCIGALVGCKHLDSEQSAALDKSWQTSAAHTLATYDHVYSHGPVGFVGHLTSAEIALRIIYERKNPAPVLVELYPRCHPVGKAYVLSALWHLDPVRFHDLSEDFMKETGEIPTMSADMVGEASREELIRGMKYQSSVYAFNPIGVSKATIERDKARRLRDTEAILSNDPNWSGIKSAFTVKEIWDVQDTAVITLATNFPSKREIRLKIDAPWHDGKITLQHSAPRLLTAATDLVESHALDNVPKSKRVAIWGTGGTLFDERDSRPNLEKAMALHGDKSEWMEVVITDWNPEGWDDNYLKLFHLLGTDVWLNEDGTVWDHKVK